MVPKFSETIKAPAIGVGLGELVVLDYATWWQRLLAGFIHSYNTAEYSFAVFGKLIGYSISHGDITPVSEGVSGPVGIAKVTQEAVALGPVSVLQLVALLSLNLAVMNVLPIPALDGGRAVFLFIEKIKGSPIDRKIESAVNSIGFVLLITLMIYVTIKDIAKFFTV